MCRPALIYEPLRKGVAFFLCLAVTAILSLPGCSRPPAPETLLRDAKTSLKRAQFEHVRALVNRIPKDSEVWQDAMLLVGEADTKEGKYAAAIETYTSAAQKDDRSDAGLLAIFSAAEIHLETGRLKAAEDLYRKILEVQPGNGITNERMAFLLSLTGRRWESLTHYSVLIRGGEADYRELALAADVGRGMEQPEFLQKCIRLAPQDQLVQLAVAVEAFDNGSPAAESLLSQFISSNPNEPAAQTLLGELLLETSDEAAFVRWYQALPEAARELPDTWFVCGLWARKEGDLEAAAECFWQSVTEMPYHRRAMYMLGQTLVALEDPQAAAVTTDSALLVELSQTVDQILISEGQKPAAIQKAAEILLKLGRIWEACAWAQYAHKSFPDAAWAQHIIADHGGSLQKDLPMTIRVLQPAGDAASKSQARLKSLLQRKTAILDAAVPRGAPEKQYSSGIRFEECSLIPFTYFNADDPATKGVRSFEQTGGGVAIIDFDQDGAPDVFLSQGTEWKTGQDHPQRDSALQDELHRNRSGERFEQVRVGLPVESVGFGQGCAAGDIDNDGFPDLYVANVGQNSLKQNMGDGTFLEVTSEAGLTQQAWTSSVMICDLNADSLPDLFDVNYLEGKDLYQMICMGRACSPSVFSGARDCVLLNQGDGRFLAAPEITPAENSKGLGLVAFCTEPGSTRPDIFVANDQVGNHFLRNQPSRNTHRLEFLEESLTSGLAYNEHGLPMACMGVAADDWDGNNLLDLFVTNFHNESNTMYLQDAQGLFTDATNSTGLKAASVPFTGWGTQSLDANLDGYPDLVVTNGHVDDYRDVGGEYHMRPQFFQNLGGRFEELTNGAGGVWFTQKFLGRGLARVDWNIDGRPEFVVSNINTPVSVLVNETSEFGHFLNVRLVSTHGARDAAGTFVELEMNGQSVVKQLTMGDGYMASNERIIQFGLGSQTSVSRLTVRWPSGLTSSFDHPGIDSTWIAVEGKDRLFTMPTP